MVPDANTSDMRIIANSLGIAFVAVFLTLPGTAADREVVGTLIEIGCATVPFGQGTAACMLRCAKRGEPIGIRTNEGTYTISGNWAADNETLLAELMTKEVIAIGEVDGLTIAVASMEPARQ